MIGAPHQASGDDLLAAVGGVDDLGGADGGQVAVTLIGKDQRTGAGTLGTGCDCRSTAVGGFIHIAVEVVIRKDRASDRGHAHDVAGFQLAFLDQLVDALCDQAVDNAVVAAGAVMELLIGKKLGFLKYDGHFTYPPSSRGSSA